ncbi:MAG: PEP-CTERM sorting domain-containing protein [Verrucomicrobiota bacterium]
MNYDNLRVIPEPSSFGLLLLGGVTLLGRRRGRRK